MANGANALSLRPGEFIAQPFVSCITATHMLAAPPALGVVKSDRSGNYREWTTTSNSLSEGSIIF
jgi:hypothetical protein